MGEIKLYYDFLTHTYNFFTIRRTRIKSFGVFPVDSRVVVYLSKRLMKLARS